MRQEGIDGGGGVRVNANQHVTEILDWIDAMKITGRDERVQASKVVAGFRIADE